MIWHRWRIVAAFIVLLLFGALVYHRVQLFRATNEDAPGQLATTTITGLELEVRATSASQDLPVHIDTFDYSANIYFGEEAVHVMRDTVTIPGGLTATIPEGCRLAEVKQSKHGFQIWFDGIETQARIIPESKAQKEADLATFDQLYGGLENAEQFELLSLDGDSSLVLGKTVIRDVATRKKLLTALRRGIEDFDHKIVTVFCFDPRHEIRATRNGKSHRITICFECNQVQTSLPGYLMIADAPQPVFDRILRDAGVPLPKPAKK